jgi:hypothetical protein
MNKKIKRGTEKLLLLSLVFLTIIIIQSNSASSACCTNPGNFCQDVNTPQECCGQSSCDPGIYEDKPCGETKCELPGCCLQTCEKTQYKDCNYAFTFINDLAPTYDCDSAPECATGCCVYLTAENNIGFCEVKPQLDCTAYELYPNTQFHVGMTEGECADLCSIGQMLTGSLTGKITDNATNSPIPNAQIIVSGISSFTNIYGEFFLENAPTGTPFIEIFATGYDPRSLSDITINYNETTSINLSLSPTLLDRGILTGYIKDGDGIPILAYVYWDQGGSFTTIAGKYTITDILQGGQEITAVADNYQTKTDLIEIQANIVNLHNLTLIGLSPEELCGNNQIDLGEQCDGTADSACSGLCTYDCLCPTSCLAAEGECYSWDYQCTAVGGSSISIESIDLCAASNYADSSYGCCNTSIQPIPPCINGEQTNEPISATDLTDTTGNICQCGAQYLDIDIPEFADGYCCDSTFHQSNNPCIAFGTFTGYILDANTSQGIQSSTIKLTKIGTTQEYSTSTISDGNYLIDVQAGSYLLLATKQGYSYNTTTLNILPSQLQSNNFTLNLISVECSQTSIAQPVLLVSHTQGTNELTLSWQHPCIDDLDRFEIYRNGQHIHTAESSDFQYIDLTTEWDTQYEYYVKAYSLYNLEASSNLVTTTTGSAECNGKVADESWCSDSTKRVVCDEENKPVLWDGSIRNSPNGDCLVAQGNNSLCNMENDETWCTDSQQDCLGTGLGQGNIFGLYYNIYYDLNQLGCLEDKSQPPQLQQRFCYYDSYQDLWTTVDKCLDCDPEMSCYDYNTEDSCVVDNCYAGPRNNVECNWYSTPSHFEKLGKGVCYQENYQGTDRCNICSQESDVFENSACSSDICSKLGNCYSNPDESSCLACDTLTSCESYTTKDDCLGDNEIKFSKGPGTCGSSSELVYSQDNCNLGRCSWLNNNCVKDGNADNADDCLGSESCVRDNSAPSTSIDNKPSYINDAGYTITFSTIGSTNATYYCFGQDCCPATLIENKNIFLSGETPGLNNREETIVLSYYSVDSNNNVEQVTSTEIFIDTLFPDMEISYEVTNSSYSETQSDITIITTVTENSICQDSLMPTSQSKMTNALITDNASLTYFGLEDATYLYTLTCKDIHQNTLTKNWEIKIDRIQKIFEESPNLQTLKESDIIISLKATDPYYCYYHKQGGILNEAFNLAQQIGEDYYYESTLSSLTSGTYIYDIFCTDTPNGNLMDSSAITFTIDQASPQTTLLALLPNGTFAEIRQTPYSLLTIKLDCLDQVQGPPQESGCASTKYCTSYGECEPYSFYNYPITLSLESGTYNLCYFSVDFLGNQEQNNCVQFSVDNTPPSLSITSPVEMGLTSTSPYLVEGLWDDTSDVEIFVKAEDKFGVLTESILANKTFNGSIGQFSAFLELFNGYNKIIATAYDSLGNKFTTVTNSYLDLVPPYISHFDIYDDYQPNNPDNDGILEYGQQITFESIANDNEWADVNNDKTTDIANIFVTIICIQDTGCFNQDIILELTPSNLTENYLATYYPFEQGILAEAEYSVILTVEDQFGNPSYKEDTFSITNAIEFIPKIYNHLDKQIDTLSYNAEFSYPITIIFDSTKPTFIDYVEVNIIHEIPALYSTSLGLNNENNLTEVLTDQLPLGLYDVNYIIVDIFGETYYYSQQFNVDDTIAPSFNLIIHQNGITTYSVGYGIYTLTIEANEQLLSIDSLEYSFSGNTGTVHDISGSGSTWYGTLYIAPIAMYANLDSKTATFNIQAKDLNQLIGNEITSGNTFTINTQGPSSPQIFDPQENNIYTNQNQIYIAGASNDWQPYLDILLRKNLASSDPLNPGWSIAASTTTQETNLIIAIWDSSIYGEIIQNSPTSITINDYSNLFSTGKFIEFSSTKPHNYLYYEITNVEIYSNPEGVDEFYTLEFTPPLEINLTSLNQDINIYDSKIPTGWFDYTLELDPWDNNLAAQARDQDGNYGTFSEIFTVIYDAQPPEFHQLTPAPESYTNEEQPLITATIRDIHGGIKEDTILFTLDNINLTCNDLSCQSNEDSSEIVIAHTPPTLEYGFHNISLSATDKAGNYGETSWEFFVDGLSPTPPNIQLIPGNKIMDGSPYTYHSNNLNPSLVIEFSDFEYINLTNLVVEYSNGNQAAISISQDSHYEFSAAFNQQLVEDTYKLKVYAIKQFPNGSWSDEASWEFNFVIDTTQPIISALISPTTNQQTNIIDIAYTETNPYYIEITGDVTPKIIEYAELYTPYQAIIDLTPGPGTKNINILISDKAGNTATTPITTEMDNIAPTISDNYGFDNIWVTTPQTVIITAEDPNGIKELRYCLVSTCYPLEDGIVLDFPYTLYFNEDQSTSVSYQTSDNFDNPSDIGEFIVLIDSIPPELTMSTFNINVNTPTITITGTYNDVNIENIVFTGDITSITYTPTATQGTYVQQVELTATEGQKTITATANDKAGNIQTESITVNLDLTSPALTIDNIENAVLMDNYYISESNHLFITGSYLLSEGVEIYPENRPSNKAHTENGQFTINITGIDGYTGQQNQETNNTITLVAKESSGNTITTTVTVIKDHMPPNINIITPSTLSTNSLSPLIEALTHEPAICSLEYWIAGANYRYTNLINQYYSIHYAQLTDILEENAETPMKITCTDFLNHESEFNFSLNIDTIQPSIFYVDIYLAELQELSPLYSSYLLFMTDTTNLEVGANEHVKCKYGTLQSYSFMDKFPNFDEGEFSGQRISDTFQLSNGDHTFFIGCEDKAGNIGELFQVDIEVNTELPIQLIDLKPTQYTNIQNPSITFDTYRNASCIISPIQGNSTPISRVFDSDSSTYVTNNAKTSVIFTGSKYQHAAQISGIADNPAQLMPLEDDQEYIFTINCEASEPEVNPSLPTDLIFTTDFTPPFININTPITGFITDETVLPIQGTTEPLSNFVIYVNDELQLYSTHTADGNLNTVAILSNGPNEIKIEVIDKATNENSEILFGVYNNIGPRTELIDPLSGDIINPIHSISAKLFPENDLIPHPLSTEFVFYTIETIQNQILNPGTIATTSSQATLNFISDWSPLPINKYRTYVVPISPEGIRGEGQNLLFEIKTPIPEIVLSSPYTSLPYTHLVLTNSQVDFTGLISTDTLLIAELFLNGQLKSTFNQKSFTTPIILSEGVNRFAIIATNLDGESGVKHGSLILDSQGPYAIITIE